MIPPFVFHFSNICHVTTRKQRLPQCNMGDDLHIFCRTNSPSTDQISAEGNNTECVGKKRFNGRVLPTGFGKSMCYVPPFWTRYYIIFFLMVICNLLLLLKSFPINIINCIKFYVNCSALTGVYQNVPWRVVNCCK
jgi:hypothetical protein